MNSYFLRPKVPLLFRSGRPFGLRAETLNFPPPSAVAGALRGILFKTRPAEFAGQANLKHLNAVGVSGPLLARRALDGGRVELFFPKPTDAAYFTKSGEVALHHLYPLPMTAETEGMDLPDGGLLPLFLRPHTNSKPCDGPAYWSLDAMLAWLHGANPAKPKKQYPLENLVELGVKRLPIDRRAHVAVKPDSLTAQESALFESNRLDFGPRELGTAWDNYEYGLLAKCSENLPEGLFPLGGKGGLTYLEAQPHWWPAQCPRTLSHALTGKDRLRLVLATPADFKDGWKPGWLIKQSDGSWQGSPPGMEGVLVLRLRAAALERWQPHSGWDLLAYKLAHPAGRDFPITPVRRLVPAGSVYWFSIEQGDAEQAARLWLRSICDDERSRQDGFGLALPGIWQAPPKDSTGTSPS